MLMEPDEASTALTDEDKDELLQMIYRAKENG
jgi:hypothetical protein